MRFVFWNINRKPLSGLVVRLAKEQAADVLILAECEIPRNELLLALNGEDPAYQFAPGKCRNIEIYVRFTTDWMRPAYESERVSIRRLEACDRLPVILAAVHLPCKLHMGKESQVFECAELARDIRRVEREAGHQRSILVGDFNMNPFEHGMIGAAGLNAVMSRAVAARGARVVQGRSYPFFYNPMWNHCGDAASPSAGSYYYDNGEHVNYYWNVFDQVLLRPGLASQSAPVRTAIVTAIGSHSLIRPDGRPDREVASDHLPLIFEVEF